MAVYNGVANMKATISATALGQYASSRFCLRCAWVRLHVKTLPFQSFPGIFSTIDRYNKSIVENHFAREQALPLWLSDLGEVDSYIDPPHWSKFQVSHPETRVTVRGEADGIFKMRDGSYTIVDYKTSKYSPAQRGLYSNYQVQLNSYAYIGERLGISPIGRLALVFMEPLTDKLAATDPRLVDRRGFFMEFAATVVDVVLAPEELIPPLLHRVQDIADMERPPLRLAECKDCQAMDSLLDALGRPL